jgi:hypothetical protein
LDNIAFVQFPVRYLESVIHGVGKYARIRDGIEVDLDDTINGFILAGWGKIGDPVVEIDGVGGKRYDDRIRYAVLNLVDMDEEVVKKSASEIIGSESVLGFEPYIAVTIGVIYFHYY